MGWACGTHMGTENSISKILVRKPEGKGPLARPWRKRESVI
jgi:hypothetical protein